VQPEQRSQLLEGAAINLEPDDSDQGRSGQRHGAGVEDGGMISLQRTVFAAICSEEIAGDGSALFCLSSANPQRSLHPAE
jgi:hypothetical protein